MKMIIIEHCDPCPACMMDMEHFPWDFCQIERAKIGDKEDRPHRIPGFCPLDDAPEESDVTFGTTARRPRPASEEDDWSDVPTTTPDTGEAVPKDPEGTGDVV